MSGKSEPLTVVFTSNYVTEDKKTLGDLVANFAKGTWEDFKTTNRHTAGKAAKFGAGVVMGGKVATEMGAVTPLKWALKGLAHCLLNLPRMGQSKSFGTPPHNARFSWPKPLRPNSSS